VVSTLQQARKPSDVIMEDSRGIVHRDRAFGELD
jgi:hypothetical protein